jgi:hypothetical protein
MATLQEIRAKLQQQNSKSEGGGGDNAIFAHWNIAEGQTATLRFLPDGDPNNTFFWVERAMIRLPFAGVKGEANSKPVTVTVPCMEMWNETCPILAEVRPWFKDKSLEEMGRKYWKKKSYLFQGFVVDSQMKEDRVPESLIRRFIISPQIFNIIKAALLDPEMEESPTDVVRGVDFKVVKTAKGGYADYSTSNWARRERALSEAELAAIETHGLFDLKNFLPKKPGEAELRVIKEMFEASVDGEAFDMERWGQYFKPAGYGNGGGGSGDDDVGATPVAQSKPVSRVAAPVAPVNEDEDDDQSTVDTNSTPTSSARAQDILAMIRNRQKA